MDLDFTDEQEELRASVRTVLERECPPSLVRAVVEGNGTADGLWERMVGLDWPALTVPEPCGGIGLGFVELAVVAEELGRVVAPGPLLPTVAQYAPAVREVGTDDQRAALLGPVAEGRVRGTLAVAEEAGSWDPADVAAVAEPDGSSWRLTGEKHYVMEATGADELAVAARLRDTRGDEGIGVFVVAGGTAGLELRPLASFDASRNYATLTLDGVVVAGDRALGPVGDAAGALRRALEEATAALALELVGTCQAILDTNVEYAKEREQFGAPIGSFQAVKHKLADMLVAVERARATAYFAAATIAEDDPRRTLAVAMAKAAAGDCQRLVTQDGIQLLGGIGYTWEHDMHLYVKRATGDAAVFGTASEHRARVADLVGL